MDLDVVISSRKDREIRKKLLKPGDFNIVPYEDAKCKILLSDVTFTNNIHGVGEEDTSRYLDPDFDGNMTVGDCDNYIDRDIDLLVQQMCKGQECLATIVYKNNEDKLAKQVDFKLELLEASEEDLIGDWPMERLYETACLHKTRGVELIKEKRIGDGFRRFNKALKLLIAIDPIEADEPPDDKWIPILADLRSKLYSNLAHCQLHYEEYEAALILCERALASDQNNIKAMYRKSSANIGLKQYAEAWNDIQNLLKLDPNNAPAHEKAKFLRPKIDKITKDYNDVVKKMFGVKSTLK